jgi:hypothetical protein
MLIAASVSLVLVGLTILIHYEALRALSEFLPGPRHLGIRGRMILVVFACFLAHTIEVWTYAIGFWLLQDELRLNSLTGEPLSDFLDFVYFSATTYTSLGFGDIYPAGQARLMAGVEALNGLMLIAWSASFTYLVMEKFWPLHLARRGDRAGRGGDGRPWYRLPGGPDEPGPA